MAGRDDIRFAQTSLNSFVHFTPIKRACSLYVMATVPYIRFVCAAGVLENFSPTSFCAPLRPHLQMRIRRGTKAIKTVLNPCSIYKANTKFVNVCIRCFSISVQIQKVNGSEFQIFLRKNGTISKKYGYPKEAVAKQISSRPNIHVLGELTNIVHVKKHKIPASPGTNTYGKLISDFLGHVSFEVPKDHDFLPVQSSAEPCGCCQSSSNTKSKKSIFKSSGSILILLRGQERESDF